MERERLVGWIIGALVVFVALSWWALSWRFPERARTEPTAPPSPTTKLRGIYALGFVVLVVQVWTLVRVEALWSRVRPTTVSERSEQLDRENAALEAYLRRLQSNR